MATDKATAILALLEASKALELAHRALVRLGDHDRASEVSDMGADVAAIMGELVAKPLAIEVAS